MPVLLEELAEETSSSNRHIAERLEGEIQRLEELLAGHAGGPLALVLRASESAQQATEHLLSRMLQIEGIWKGLLNALKNNPLREDAGTLLSSVLTGFESSRDLVKAARTLCEFAAARGAEINRVAEVDAAHDRLEELIEEATASLKHRQSDWKPSDPGRFALGLKQAKEGKIVKADEARARFRRTSE